jgi:hypothetical protein
LLQLLLYLLRQRIKSFFMEVRFYRTALLSAAVLFSLLPVMGQASPVRINEIMALNESTLADSEGDYPDWIELYNTGAEAVNLAGWTLTDDPAEPRKWIFPDTVLDAGNYLVVFASGKNRYTPGGEMHTGFKLDAEGEYLALADFAGNSASLFSPAFPAMGPDESYGAYQDTFVLFSVPTPGAANDPAGLILPAPSFTVAHGLFDSPFQVGISTVVPEAEIYYTTDGSAPSVSNGIYYSGPVNITTTTVLRAVSSLEDTRYSEVATASYIFPGDVIHQPNDPAGYPAEWGPYTAISGTAIADYEMDPELVSDPADSASVVQGLKSIPTLSLVTGAGNLFSHSTDPDSGGIYIYTGPPLDNSNDGLGKGWERPASAEYFDADGNKSFQVNCGVQLQGGHSRRPEKSPKHSFRLVFKDEYGPARLEYPLFGEDGAATSFNTVIFRAGFGNSWVHWTHSERARAQYQRDIYAKDSQRDLGHPSSRSSYVHLYLNGIYWGIYAPSERMDSDFAASYMGGNADDYDVIKDYQDVANGTIDAWNTMMAKANAGLADNKAYQAIQGKNPDGSPNPGLEAWLDVANLTDYMIINFYGGNTDWDHHNWAAMRNRKHPGDGFKFFCWDAEHIFDDLNTNVVNEDNPDCPSRVFQDLKQNESYRVYFADRVHELLFNGGAFTPEIAEARWDIRTEQVQSALPAEAARWGDYRRDVHPWQAPPFELYTYEDYWIPYHNYMLEDYFPERTSIFLGQLRAAGLYPALAAPRFFIEGEEWPVPAVNRGDALTMTSEEGVVYYTTDGSDPAAWEFDRGGEDLLIEAGATKYVMVPDGDLGDAWRTGEEYDDSGWTVTSGEPGGIGYDQGTGYEDWISLDVADRMSENATDPNTSCYVRIPFTLEAGEAEKYSQMLLRVSYDDGFAAFLNGVRVAEANAPISLSWNSAASNSHEAAGSEVFDLSAHLGLLKQGENMLAIQALNTNTSSSDFLIYTELQASEETISEISKNAVMYTEAIPLEQSAHVVARTYLNGAWSAAMNGVISFTEDLDDLRITEIQYNPTGGEDIGSSDFEFLELKNIGTATLEMEGVRIAEGVDYTFPPLSMVPGGFVVLASDDSAFYARYGFAPDGVYSGNLNNSGEFIRIDSPGGDTITRLLYDDAWPWPVGADGLGYSLVPVVLNPPKVQAGPESWRISLEIGGSPGRDDTGSTGVGEVLAAGPVNLAQNYPNPFTGTTYISFELPLDARVELAVYNLMGQKVSVLESGRLAAGTHVATWSGTRDDGTAAGDGIYVYRLVITDITGTHIFSRKMIKLR